MRRAIIAIAMLLATFANASAQRLANINIEAQYITDKMVEELGLSSHQRNSILQINLNYLGGITSYRDISSSIWKQRNRSLKAMLNSAQWALYKKANYFYRPIGWEDGAYVHNIYSRYPKHNKKHGKPAPNNGKGHKYGKPATDRPPHDAPNRRPDHFGSRR